MEKLEAILTAADDSAVRTLASALEEKRVIRRAYFDTTDQRYGCLFYFLFDARTAAGVHSGCERADIDPDLALQVIRAWDAGKLAAETVEIAVAKRLAL